MTCAAIVVVSVLSVVNGLSSSVDAGNAAATTTTRPKSTTQTVPAPIIALGQFPVQGPCAFIDTYGAPRGGGRTHEGVDIIAKKGQYIYAVQDGVLTKKYVDSRTSLSGNGWRLTAADGTYFFYGHMSAFGDGLDVGSAVVSGQIIGFVGATGNAGTSHLHFEIHPGGGPSINPTASVKVIDGCKITTAPAAALVPATTTGGSGSAPSNVTTTTATTPPTTSTAPPTQPAAPVPAGLAQDSASRWQFIEPVAVLTASSSTALSPRVTKKVNVVGVAGISKTTSAVIVRISASSAQPASIVVHPCDTAAPIATTLFVEPGPMAVGYATVGLVAGQLCVTSTARALARITVVGQLSTSGVGVAPIPTKRAIDTRTTSSLTPNKLVTLTPEMLGAPQGTQAVSATFTVLDPKSGGTLLITPCGASEVKTPFNAARSTSFNIVVRTNEAGLCVQSTVAINLLVDVDAAWGPAAPALLPITPVRRLDSRDVGGPLGATPTQVMIGTLPGGAGVVATVQANVTLIGGTKSSSVFVWPCSQTRPEASIGVVQARKRATFAILTAVSDGAFCISSNTPVNAVVDIVAVG